MYTSVSYFIVYSMHVYEIKNNNKTPFPGAYKKKNTFTDVHGLFADFTNVLILIPHFSTHDTGTNIN